MTITAGIAIMSPNAHSLKGVWFRPSESRILEIRFERLLSSTGNTRRVLVLRGQVSSRKEHSLQLGRRSKLL